MAETTLQLTPDEVKRSLENLKLERDAIVLYDQLAEIEKDPDARRAVQAHCRATSGATPTSGPNA